MCLETSAVLAGVAMNSTLVATEKAYMVPVYLWCRYRYVCVCV